MSDDAELLRRYVAENSQEAFAELVRQHLGLVYHTALRHLDGDIHGSQDVAQGVFTDLARKAAQLVDRPLVAGWLHTSTRFAALRYRRDEKRRQAREQEAGAMHELTNESAPAVEWERMRPVIDEALQALKPEEREAVLLRFFEGRDYVELGARLHLSQHTVRSRVERALTKMQSRLARHGIVSTVAALSATLTAHAASSAPFDFAGNVAQVALDSVAAGASNTVAVSLGTLGLMQATSLILVGSLIANAIIGSLYFAESPPPPNPPFVLQARPVMPRVEVPEFPPPAVALTDASTMARKLRDTGFSAFVLKGAVGSAVGFENQDARTEAFALVDSRRRRWNPDPVVASADAVSKSVGNRRKAIYGEIGLDEWGTPLTNRYRNLSATKAAAVEKLEKDYDEVRRLGFGTEGVLTPAVSNKIAAAFETDLRSALTPSEATDYFRYDSEIGKRVSDLLKPLAVSDEVQEAIADAELEADGLNRATLSDRAQRNARSLEVLRVYRRELGDERFLAVSQALQGGEGFASVDPLYQAAGFPPVARVDLYFAMFSALNELSATAPAARPAVVAKVRTALTSGAGLSAESAAAFEATSLGRMLKRVELEPDR